MTNKPRTIYLKDYRPPEFYVETIDLEFDLQDHATMVTALMRFQRNDKTQKSPLVLKGKDLILKTMSLDGKMLDPKEYVLSPDSLTLHTVPDNFTLKITNEIHPEKNTELNGLYRSNDLFCTQCEAQGFRRITYFPDRPDVMAKFTTTITADKKRYPVLLSNGNCIAKGEKGDRHWVKWEDPFKKPCYLFALVAGNLVAIEDHFLTRSGRLVTLKIYVEWENQDKCQHALSALKKAMKWDEDTYGREYDLDIYMIVAVNDFNMGAMENKGLNIFNSKYVLARPETATDTDYHYIDAVVGHEYFHNWSGNRVTCRDWFQLSLKEGLTVFREKQFSADLAQSPLSLIENTVGLRSQQFAEDAGPMAHPVRPESYIEINNFYTSTVYEKGGEVVRMIKTLLGPAQFRKGMDLYFERHDGQAVTIEDFVKSMEDASGQNLTQFRLWYSQAGTPEVAATGRYDEKSQTYHLNLKQSCPSTPLQSHKLPMHIPIAVGLLDSKGQDLLNEKTTVLSLQEAEQTFRFEGIKEKPILSFLRGFSAPIKVKTSLSDEELAFLLANDSDEFNRWDASQKLTESMILKMVKQHQNGEPLQMDPLWLKAQQAVLQNKTMNPALKAAILTLPPTSCLIGLTEPADTDAIFTVKKWIAKEIAQAFRDDFILNYQQSLTPGVYQYSTALSDRRTLKNTCLQYLLQMDDKNVMDLIKKQWHQANNMTDAFGVLVALADKDCKEREEILSEFYDRWQHDPLVVNKWLRIQATSQLPNTLTMVKQLMQHAAFDLKNPNKVYALIGGFGSNLVRFHDKSGKGYEFITEVILQLDSLNPQTAARMMQPFTRLQQFDKERQEKMRVSLERIKAKENLSKDVNEIIIKCLGTQAAEAASA